MGSKASSFRALLRGGGIIFAGLVLELAISFLAKVFIARALGRVDYGIVTIGITVMSSVSTLTMLGLNSALGRYIPRFEQPSFRRSILYSVFQIVVPVSVAAGLLVAVFANVVATAIFGNADTTPVIRIFALIIPFSALITTTIGALQGYELTLPKVAIQNILLPVARFAFIVVALVLGLGSLGIAGAYAVAYVLAATLGIYYLYRHTSLFDRHVSVTTKRRELLTFSLPLMFSSAMFLVLSDIDTFMLGYFATPGDIGVYRTVYPLAKLLVLFLTSFNFVFVPIMSRHHSEEEYDEMRRIYQIVSKWIFIGVLPIFLLYVAFPKIIINLTFGPQFTAGSSALGVLAVGFFIHTTAGLNINTLMAIGHTRIIMVGNALTAASNLLLNLALIPRYGILGAAAATTLSYLLMNLLFSGFLYSITGIHPLSRGMIKPGMISVSVLGSMYMIVKFFLMVTVTLLVILFPVFLLTYVFVVVRYGSIEKEELQLLWAIEERTGLSLKPVKRAVERVMKS